MKYDIYLSDLTRKTVLRLPILPPEMPTITKASKNEEFETFNNGTFNIIGDTGLMTFTLESWLPALRNKYPFAKVKNINPYKYIDLVNVAMRDKKPLRVIILRGDGTYVINNTFSVESFEYHENRIGNFQFTISFKQWRGY